MDDEHEDHQENNGGPTTDQSPQASLRKWRERILGAEEPDPIHSEIKEGLLIVAEVVEANLEQSMRNGSSIEILKGQMETVISKTEIGAHMVDRVDRELLETTKEYKAELSALKAEVAETKTIAEAIAAHLGLTVSSSEPEPG